ncbi:MAG TPA: IPT/TIG domain-containing protein, partial [Verrucomicrobiae bacterium]|nr:IPT/TIG domain-containing protein [Verrucomicrobiae bacterium]
MGEKVTLEGSGFTGATAVTFNGNASVFRVVSDERIVATVPMASVEGVIEVWKEDASASLPKAFVLDRTETSSVVGWGAQSSQFGLGQTAPPADLTNAVAIAAGTYSSVAIDGARRLVAWGMFTNLPPALRTNEFTAVAANGGLVLAVDTTGRMRAHHFEAGDFAYKAFPAAATNIIAVTWGLALRRDGTVFGLATESTPTGVSHALAIPPAIAIVGNLWSGLALHRNGRCTAWGDMLPENVTVPLTNVVAISEGGLEPLLLTQAGELFRWHVYARTLRKVDANVALAVGNYDYALSLKEDGAITGYGAAGWGQTNVPPYLSDVVALSCNMAHVLALARLSPKIVVQPADLDALPGATVRLQAKVVGDRPIEFQWFHNGAWLAGATNVDLTLENLGEAAAGEYQLIAWNDRGVAASESASVNMVDDFTAFGFSRPELPGSKVMIFGRGLDHATAVTFNGIAAVFRAIDENRLEAIVPQGIVTGKVRVWVNGAFSEVPETYVAPPDPQLLIAWSFQYGIRFSTSSQDAQPFLAISAGVQHGVALRADGKVFTWRHDSTAMGAVSPIRSTTNAIAVAAGSSHSLALKSDGTVIGWGSARAPAPNDLKGVTAIAAGDDHSLALLEDGTVRGWGDNTEKAAEPPPGLRDVVKVAASECSIALKRDGTAVIWGGRYLEPKIIRGSSRIIDASSRFVNLFLCEDGSTIVDYPGERTPNVPPAPTVALRAAVIADYDKGIGVRPDGTLFAWPTPYYTIGAVSAISNITALVASPLHAAVLARQLPIIVRQPQDLYLPAGASGTLSADVRFASTYQWFRDGQLYSTNAALVISAMDGTRAGEYVLKASNGVGEVSSRTVRVELVVRPTLSSFFPGRAAIGDTVRIKGNNLAKATAVTFNGNGAFFRVVDSTTIDAIVPNAWAHGPVAVLFNDYRAQANGFFELTAREGRLVSWGGEYWGPLWLDAGQVAIPPEAANNPVLLNVAENFNSVRLGSGKTFVWTWKLPRADGDPVAFGGDWTGIAAMTSEGRLFRASGIGDASFMDTGITDAVNIVAAPRAILR